MSWGCVLDKLYFALSNVEIHEDFFDPDALSEEPVTICFEGQEYLNIRMDENERNGKVTITYDFSKFD